MYNLGKHGNQYEQIDDTFQILHIVGWLRGRNLQDCARGYTGLISLNIKLIHINNFFSGAKN